MMPAHHHSTEGGATVTDSELVGMMDEALGRDEACNGWASIVAFGEEKKLTSSTRSNLSRRVLYAIGQKGPTSWPIKSSVRGRNRWVVVVLRAERGDVRSG